MRIGASGRTAWMFGLIVILAAVQVITGVAVPGRASSEDATEGRPSTAVQRAAGRFTDVTDPGLVRALEALAPTGALEAFDGDELRASRAVTLGEFAQAAAAAFGVTVPAGKPAPQAALQALVERGALISSDRSHTEVDLALPVTVGEMTGAVLRLAGMEAIGERWPSGSSTAARLELARAAGVLPASIKVGDASRPATRAEAVQLLYEARRVLVLSGQLQRSTTGTASIDTELGEVRVRLSDDAVVVRNGQPASLEDLRDGDTVRAVVDLAGRARVVAAEGRGLALDLDSSELVETARRALEDFARQLTPEQWQMILQGDWAGFRESAKPQIYERLTQAGIAPEEAEALMSGDWETLQSLAADRLADEAGRRLDVSPELVRSVLASDWATARQLAQQELIERIINDVIVPNAQRQSTAG
ncbi:hypothetical protein [Geochorda subterranea]|uniref:S-layer family protein n=1 Tax=Geochorda subterranea TaxID=3109564 RepID=A0ABZ1BS85_9FIRM|nr:hypothetical protein [Limnochorda sp. LNt]WRP15456.1 hypothetical protein VLY81_04645 [Limnochorda sp. LNt]